MILICILILIGTFIVSFSFNGLSDYVIGFFFISIYFWYKFIFKGGLMIDEEE